MAKPTALTPQALVALDCHQPDVQRLLRETVTKDEARSRPASPVPLQVRWPREDVRAVKIAAAEAEQTISEFMLACFHAYMKTQKGLQ